MQNDLRAKQLEKLSALGLPDFFKTGAHRERKLFFKVVSTPDLQQNCVCRPHLEEVKALQQLATQAFKDQALLL